MNDENHEDSSLGTEEGRASDKSIVRTHAQVRRTPVEASPVLFFTMIALTIVLVFAWFYLRRHMGGESLERQQMYLAERSEILAFNEYLENADSVPVEIDYLALGEQVYARAACIGCHQADGNGVANTYPPLGGSKYVASDDPTVTIKILIAGLAGPIEVKGNTYNGLMPAVGALSNDDLAGVTTYIRGSFGNTASAVSPEQIQAVRDEIGQRGNYTAEELAVHFE